MEAWSKELLNKTAHMSLSTDAQPATLPENSPTYLIVLTDSQPNETLGSKKKKSEQLV